MAKSNIELIEEAYVLYYRRPADLSGLDFWKNKLDQANGDISKIIDAFANSAEARALYGDLYNSAKSATAVGNMIDTVFGTLVGDINRVDANKQSYIDQFTAGKASAGAIALSILDDAKDAKTGNPTCVDNKETAAHNFVTALDPDGDRKNVNATYDDQTSDLSGDTKETRDWLATITDKTKVVPDAAAIEQAVRSHVIDIANASGANDGQPDPWYNSNPSSYELSSNVSQVTEGGSITFTLTTKGVDTGTQLGYEIKGTNITDADFKEGLTGTFKVGDDGTASVTLHPLSDNATEGNEPFTLSLGGDLANVKATATIVDATSAGISVSLEGSTAKVNETAPDNVVTYTVSLSKAAPATVSIPYTLSGTADIGADYTASDDAGAVTDVSGFITIEKGAKTGTLTLTMVEDQTAEGTETVTFTLGSLPSGYENDASGKNFFTTRIGDTSNKPVGPTAQDITEGGSYTATDGDDIFVYKFDVVNERATTTAKGGEAVIKGFDPAHDVLQFDDTSAQPMTLEAFLQPYPGVVIAVNPEEGSDYTFIGFDANSKGIIGSVIVLGVQDDTLGLLNTQIV